MTGGPVLAGPKMAAAGPAKRAFPQHKIFISKITGSGLKLNLQGKNLKLFEKKSWSKIAPPELRLKKYRKNGFFYSIFLTGY